MKKKDDLALVLAEGAAITALIGAGGIALPLAAAAYGVWRFGGIVEGIADRVNGKPASRPAPAAEGTE